MKIEIGPRGVLQIDDARIVYRNFSGAESKFNRKGDRNFALVIPDEATADDLRAEGWNIKVKPPRDADDTPFMYLPVKIKFTERGPKVYLISGGNTTVLDEETVDLLDDIDILSVDMDIRPYDWEMGGKEGRTAYLQCIRVTQQVDRFAASLSDENLPF